MSTSEQRFLEKRPKNHHKLNWSHPTRVALMRLRDELEQAIRRSDLNDGAVIIDYGCATKPYQPLFPAGTRYMGADLIGNKHADLIIGEDGRIGCEDGTADVVLSTQVLEHVLSPQSYLAECKRVLKPGGRLILSTHGLWRYHRDPIDLWRWTGDGLIHAAEIEGFKVREIVGIIGLAAVGVQLFQDATYMSMPRPLRRPYAGVMQWLVGFFDRLHSAESRRADAMIYLIVAER